MRVFIDTHVLVWWWGAVTELSRTALATLNDPRNEILVSAAAAYEIELKRAFDPLLQQLPYDLAAAAALDGFVFQPVTAEIATVAGRLPKIHRDPWDRILAAHAMVAGVPVISVDRKLIQFGVSLIW